MDRETQQANETFVAMVVADLPIAIRRLYKAQASQSSFNKWRSGVIGPDGQTYRLRVIDIEGQGPSVVPSELRSFLLSIAKEDTYKPKAKDHEQKNK